MNHTVGSFSKGRTRLYSNVTFSIIRRADSEREIEDGVQVSLKDEVKVTRFT